jgi:hypothetical protein
MVGATLEYLVALVTWRAGFVHWCCTYRLLPYNVPYAFFLIQGHHTNICHVGLYCTKTYHNKILSNFVRCIATQNFIEI